MSLYFVMIETHYNKYTEKGNFFSNDTNTRKTHENFMGIFKKRVKNQ